LVLGSVVELIVLTAGVGWVLRRRHQVGRATGSAVWGLVLLAVSTLAGTGWTLSLLDLTATGDTDGLLAIVRWADLAGAFTEAAALAGVIALTASVFVGRSAGDGS
jgi:hypothetical protein